MPVLSSIMLIYCISRAFTDEYVLNQKVLFEQGVCAGPNKELALCTHRYLFLSNFLHLRNYRTKNVDFRMLLNILDTDFQFCLHTHLYYKMICNLEVCLFAIRRN